MTKSTIDPDCGMFVKGARQKQLAYEAHTAFTRQMNTARGLYGPQPAIPKLTADHIREVLRPAPDCYPQRDRGIITDPVEAHILTRQKRL